MQFDKTPAVDLEIESAPRNHQPNSSYQSFAFFFLYQSLWTIASCICYARLNSIFWLMQHSGFFSQTFRFFSRWKLPNRLPLVHHLQWNVCLFVCLFSHMNKIEISMSIPSLTLFDANLNEVHLSVTHFTFSINTCFFFATNKLYLVVLSRGNPSSVFVIFAMVSKAESVQVQEGLTVRRGRPIGNVQKKNIHYNPTPPALSPTKLHHCTVNLCDIARCCPTSLASIVEQVLAQNESISFR